MYICMLYAYASCFVCKGVKLSCSDERETVAACFVKSSCSIDPSQCQNLRTRKASSMPTIDGPLESGSVNLHRRELYTPSIDPSIDDSANDIEDVVATHKESPLHSGSGSCRRTKGLCNKPSSLCI